MTRERKPAKRQDNPLVIIGGVVLLLVGLGCTYNPPITRTTGRSYPPLSSPGAVQVYLGEQRPPHGYEEIGIITVAPGLSDWPLNRATDAAREKAAREGADVLIYRGARSKTETDALPDPVFGGRTQSARTSYEFVAGRAKPAPVVPAVAAQ